VGQEGGNRKDMVHVDRCLKCGRPGSLHRKFFKCGKPNCKCARGELHSGLVVKHYVGYAIMLAKPMTAARPLSFSQEIRADLQADAGP